MTAAGGMMDAWIYLAHGHVFANAQTGNVVLLALNLTSGNLPDARHEALSILAFIAGLLCSRLSAAWLKERDYNSRTIRLAAEIVMLVLLSFIAGHLANGAVAASVGFIAAVQITSLSHAGAVSFNTGMTTGNLRGAITAAVAVSLDPANDAERRKGTMLGLMCFSFLAGACLGAICTRHAGDATALVIAALVFCAMVTMWNTTEPAPSP